MVTPAGRKKMEQESLGQPALADGMVQVVSAYSVF